LLKTIVASREKQDKRPSLLARLTMAKRLLNSRLPIPS
jgi:hypothetical protein